MSGDLSKQENCLSIVDRTVKNFGRLEILVCAHYNRCSFLPMHMLFMEDNVFGFFVLNLILSDLAILCKLGL